VLVRRNTTRGIRTAASGLAVVAMAAAAAGLGGCSSSATSSGTAGAAATSAGNTSPGTVAQAAPAASGPFRFAFPATLGGEQRTALQTLRRKPTSNNMLAKMGYADDVCFKKSMEAIGTVSVMSGATYYAQSGADFKDTYVIAFQGSFGSSSAASALSQAIVHCSSGTIKVTGLTGIAPGPDGGTFDTAHLIDGSIRGSSCVWSTSTTAAYVEFTKDGIFTSVASPADACRAIRQAVETQG
jgi:hypothetical protein